MANHERATTPSLATLTIFHQKLKTEWKSTAWCGREYYRSNEIIKWMLRKGTDELTTNAGLLLTEVYQSLHLPQSWKISNGEDRCLIVFAILLELGYGQLIDVFQRSGTIDKKLPISDISNTELLEKDLRKWGIRDTEGFWESFKERMWSYHPCPLSLGMRNMFSDPDRGRWIMPFCKRQRINMKGGTAQVWEVVVQESQVPHSLALAAGRSVYTDSEYGPCYIFALKTFTEESIEIFEWERDAYLAMQTKGHLSGMVQFLGEYEIHEKLEGGEILHTRNILLEYGDEDLEEFFASSFNYPPNLNAETIQYWRSLANVAKALDAMHDLDLERENGRHDRYSGWHCDLKPDNILRVDGEFKLADFGFAKFKPMNPGRVPKQYMRGGTETYGAPECDRARLDSSISVSQTIDTWSFGCVLSVSATWVVLGYQGVLAYHELRRIAIGKLRERQKRGEDITVPVADDAFHNGVDVLPEIREWHMHLRSLLRKSDTITGLILDFIDEKMLLTESARQSTSGLLYPALTEQLRVAQIHYSQLVEQCDVNPVTESVKEALLGVEKMGNHPVDTQELCSENSFLAPPQRHQVKSSRIDKSRKMGVIQGKVAHRQDALQPNVTKIRGAQPSSMISSQYTEPNYTERTQLTPGAQPPESSSSPSFTYRPVMRPTSQVASYTSAISPRIYIEKEAVDSTRFTPSTILAADQRTAQSRHGNYSEDLRDAETSFAINAPFDSHSILPEKPVGLLPISTLSPETPQMWNHLQHQTLWPIYQEHQALKSKGKSFARLFKKEHDNYLKNFLDDRDIMFLVDNDTSMSPFWEMMTVVMETLVPKVEAFDKDGLDLEFTIGKRHNVSKNPASKILSKFKAAKEEALSQPHHYETDMASILTRIFDRYLSGTMGEMTLIILTNGVWGGTLDITNVERAIANFLKKPGLEEKLADRWFTIQFISFGDEASTILTHLDNDIAKKYSIPDVVDTEPVSGRMYKMILGSIVDTWDKASSPISPTTPSSPSHLSLPSAINLGTPSPSTSSPIMRQNSSRSSKRLSGLRNLLNGPR
ncbi:hypothetical protein K449DRAFT_397906 [Hypoxylon sp. EC38]|nr:hypothetical protein K449DRAFT_397906 [Hypoxylon sp. EC38]